MVEMSESITELAKALVKVQAVLKGAKKDSVNPFHKSKYADLSSVWEACREPLTENNIAVVQATSYRDGIIYISTMLMHESGQWLRDELGIKPKEDTPQGVGSAITYGRRYGLSAMVGIAPEDDDAEAAQGRPQTSGAAARFRTPTTPATTGSIVRPPVAAGRSGN